MTQSALLKIIITTEVQRIILNPYFIGSEGSESEKTKVEIQHMT